MMHILRIDKSVCSNIIYTYLHTVKVHYEWTAAPVTVDKLAINDYQLEAVGHSNTTAATQLGPRSVLRLEIQVSCDWSSCCRLLIGCCSCGARWGRTCCGPTAPWCL